MSQLGFNLQSVVKVNRDGGAQDIGLLVGVVYKGDGLTPDFLRLADPDGNTRDITDAISVTVHGGRAHKPVSEPAEGPVVVHLSVAATGLTACGRSKLRKGYSAKTLSGERVTCPRCLATLRV